MRMDRDSEPRRVLQGGSDSEAPAAECVVTALAISTSTARAGIHADSHALCMFRASAAPSHPASYALKFMPPCAPLRCAAVPRWGTTGT